MDFFEQMQGELLDFNKTKRKVWEEKRYPYAAHIELTPRCNFNCIHCYLQNHHHASGLSYDDIIDILNILYDKGILFLTLTGGEIFTRSDFKDIYVYAKKKGFLIELFTNGILIDGEIIDLLKEYPPLLVDVSIYGACEDTYKEITGCVGAFSRVIENCEKLKKENIRVALKSPILKESYREIDDMKKIADKIGVPIAFSFEICSTVDGGQEPKEHALSMYDVLRYEFNASNIGIFKEIKSPRRENDKIKLYGCKIGKNSFVIDYNGNMCPCMKFKHVGVKLNKENFNSIWRTFGKYQEEVFSSESKCVKCKYVDYCEICSAEMDFLYGNPQYRNESDCECAKARYHYFVNKKPMNEILKNL